MNIGEENRTLKLSEDSKGNLNKEKMKICNDDNDTSIDCDFNGSYYLYNINKRVFK